MSEAEAAAAAEVEAINTTDCHGKGPVSAVWMTPEAGMAVLTAGADGMVSLRQIRPGSSVNSVKIGKTVTAMDINPDRTMAAVAIDNNYIKILLLPDMKTRKLAVTRFTMPAHCCSFGKDGKQLIAAADDGLAKVLDANGSEKKTVSLRPKEGTNPYMRGVALDPENKYAAMATADGCVLVYELLDGQQSKAECRKAIAAKVDPDDSSARVGMAWHPDGTLLAVAGPENDVLLLERFNWEPASFLTGGHSGSVRVIAFSPNGIYAATAGDDCKVVVWLVERQMQVSVRKLPAPASSLSWHPSTNALLCGTTAGSYGIWPSPVPTGGDSNLPSPHKLIDELDREADRAAAVAAAAAVNEDGGGGDEELFDDDYDEGADVIKRRGLKHTGGAAAAAGAGGGDPEMAAVLDGLDALLEEVDAGRPGAALNPRAPSYPSSLPYPKPCRPQGPIQPGCTPEEDEGGEVQARFLAYNQEGCVVSKSVDGQNYIEVLFRDTSKGRPKPKMLTDLFGFTAASLGEKGVAYISPAAGEDRPSMLMYRSFESWGSDKDWSVAFPEGEEAAVVAAGSSVVAVATSKQLLRLYSLAGRQLSILSLRGPVVALAAAAAASAGPAVACQHHLAVVWAQGPPEPLQHTQQLAYTVYDVSSCSQVCGGELVLSPGSSLTWLAFSTDTGLLAAMDSESTLCVRSPDWGGAWVPVLDAAAAKASTGADRLWPVYLDRNSLTAVVTTTKAPYPQVLPHPVNTQVPLSLPLAPADGAPAAAAAGQAAPEEMVIRTGLHLAQLKSLESSGGDCVSTELESSVMECDRTAIRLISEYLKAGKQARALELVHTLHTIKSVEGALKLANHYRLNVLAERIQALLEQRLEWEEQQQATAAAAQVQEPVWAAAAAAGGGDGENDMEGQLDQASQFEASDSIRPAAAPAMQGSKLAPMFGSRTAGAAAAGTAAAGGSGGVLKRKPAAAGLGSGGGGKAGGGVNPFARKKVK